MGNTASAGDDADDNNNNNDDIHSDEEEEDTFGSYNETETQSINESSSSIIETPPPSTNNEQKYISISSGLKSNNSTKLPSDGYKWRKYGQKTVKGRSPRSYHKCTYPGCPVKKYVEIGNGKDADIITYRGGDHSHDPAKITRLNAPDQISFKTSVLESLIPTDQSHFNQKEINSEEISNLNSVEEIKPLLNSPSKNVATNTIYPSDLNLNINVNNMNNTRLVVETSADINPPYGLDDGYGWRKYGQKQVKGGQHARSYFRCTEENCTVKKQVEQRNNTIYHVYEGKHNHTAPGLDDGLTPKKKRRKSVRTPLSEVADTANELCRKRVEENQSTITFDSIGEQNSQIELIKSIEVQDSFNQSNDIIIPIITPSQFKETVQ